MGDRKKALLVIHTNSYFANLWPVAQLLGESGRYEPILFFVSAYPTVAAHQALCRAEGISFIGPKPARRADRFSVMLKILSTPLRESVAFNVIQLQKKKRALRRFIREQGIGLLVLPADNRYDIALYVEAAHAEGIPAVVIPAFMATSDEWAQAIGGDPAHGFQRLANRLAAAAYPSWAYSYAGRELIALPAGELVARQWLGLAPPRPWTLHSGRADAIAVESAALRDYCIAEGLPARQLVLTGSVDHDRMHGRLKNGAALREEIYRRLGLPPDKPMLPTALPPDQLYGRGRPECDFATYDELARFWVASLAAIDGFNVVVSAHPSVHRDSLKHLETPGVRIADEPVSALIPLCDIYVASVSATIQWAISCGKPVVNYDVYRYRYPDYLGVGGVLTMEEQDGFVGALSRLTGDAAFYAELRAKQAREAARWGNLDGEAGRRLLQLFDELIEREARG
jgi:hypothetical protein